MNKNSMLIGIAVVVVLGIGMWAVSMNSPASQPENSGGEDAAGVPSAAPSGANQPAAQPASKKEFTVSGQNFSFTPSTMTVKKGDTVRITFKSGDMMHDLKIDELGVATKILKTGEEDTVEFIADKVGAFEYYCSVGSHRAKGMKGTFTVTE